ncbi:hypothetical protein [Nostoc flagelliforme]|uniref:hypothetical protein n=1 Tax=Nostoc flagelliforme TaxID=1306274 RepID=UPI0016827463|nr:hypothetical protein [Nostoc flagelliforme]
MSLYWLRHLYGGCFAKAIASNLRERCGRFLLSINIAGSLYVCQSCILIIMAAIFVGIALSKRSSYKSISGGNYESKENKKRLSKDDSLAAKNINGREENQQ